MLTTGRVLIGNWELRMENLLDVDNGTSANWELGIGNLLDVDSRMDIKERWGVIQFCPLNDLLVER